MDKLRYKLPAKALEIIEELASEELYQVSFYMYLSFCCSNMGFFHAADQFMNSSKEERYHFTRLSDFLKTRGVEPEVPAVKAPTIPFQDLITGIEAAYKLEISVTEKYDEAIKMIRDVDTMAYLKLCEFMSGQQYALDGLQRMWTTFKDLSDIEEQMEAERSYFGSDTHGVPTASNS